MTMTEVKSRTIGKAWAITHRIAPASELPFPQLLKKVRRKVEKAGIGTIHSGVKCRERGNPCPIHNPSDHHMNEWPWLVRYDKKNRITERVCPHGVGHPDPDSIEYYVARGRDRAELETHGCWCNCCHDSGGITGADRA